MRPSQILDPLTAATGITKDDIRRLADRYPGARGIRNAVTAILEIDSGAASPEETRVRLLSSDAGLRPTHSQIRITDGFEETVIADGDGLISKVGVNCDCFATQGRHAAEMAEFLQSQGWLTVHALPGHSDGSIAWRTRNAVWSRLRRRPAAPR